MSPVRAYDDSRLPGWQERPFSNIAGNGSTWTRAYIALGSNVGDRLDMIEKACNALAAETDIRLLRTSSLYETEPMYVEDQARFLNGACEIETRLPPMQLLDRLQAIESQMGRVKLVDKGPRNIDLDILLYGQEIIHTKRLIVPHRLMLEREFVLRPLCDIIPDETPPTSSQAPQTTTFAESLLALPLSTTPISTVTPLSPHLSLYTLDPRRPTHIMSILNVTPDSFSDGGEHLPNDTTSLLSTIESHIKSGATIIDVGGQSSRPNAPDISSAEEIARVLPAIKLIRSLDATPSSRAPNSNANNISSANHIPPAISIDTYRAPVAAAAIAAGAHIINDISAGVLDKAMLSTAASKSCTIVLMHMRGTPTTMTSRASCSYPAGLIPTIAAELVERVAAAQEAGVRRWRIVLDPGVGFAKTQDQNLEILRKLGELKAAKGLQGLPWLVGSSRKGFVGKITGVESARERSWGTAATVAASVVGGADVVRVHDVKEMAMVGRMCDAIWRV